MILVAVFANRVDAIGIRNLELAVTLVSGEIEQHAATRTTTHPGEILREEFLKPLKLSANALAAELHVPANRISAIVKGARGVTADTAMRLARYFDTTPEFWLNLQTQYDLTKTRMEVGKQIARRVRPRAAA